MKRPITDVIRDYRNGALVAMATDNLAEVTEAVRRTRKAGSVTIKLTLTPEAGSAHGVDVAGDVSVKLPRPTLPKALFFVDADGSLVRNDPAQADLYEDHVDDSTGEVTSRPRLRDVGAVGQ